MLVWSQCSQSGDIVPFLRMCRTRQSFQWRLFCTAKIQDGSTCCICKYFSSPQNTMSTARSLWLFISHRIHVWYIYLYKCWHLCKYTIHGSYGFGYCCSHWTYFESGLFLTHFAEMLGAEPAWRTPNGVITFAYRTPCGVHFRCKNIQNKVDGVQGMSKMKLKVPFYLVVLLLSSRICEKKGLEKTVAL